MQLGTLVYGALLLIQFVLCNSTGFSWCKLVPFIPPSLLDTLFVAAITVWLFPGLGQQFEHNSRTAFTMAQQFVGRNGGLPPFMPHQTGLGIDPTGSLKIPPAWDPAWAAQYPFSVFTQDALLWSQATDVEAERQGPAMVMRLGGTAKALAREIDIQVLAQGAIQDIGDGQGAVQHTGVTLLLYALARKFSPLSPRL